MDEAELRAMASQLSRPQGEMGIDVGHKMNALNATLTAHTLAALDARPSEVIAELGPGNGALSEALLHTLGSGGRYHGIEPSETMAEEARRCLGDAPCTVDICCGDHLCAELADGSLDGLMAVNVLYFIDDLDGLFERIRGWLKPGGRTVFGIRSDHALKQMPFTQYGFNIRSQQDIEAQLRRHGFGDVGSDYHDEGTVVLGELELPVDSVIIKGVR